MNLDKLYRLQEELDKHIWERHRTLEKMDKEELLDSTILALLVEVGELANTTRCFKHWSTKGMMEKEIVLDELADVLHFYLSTGNQMGYKMNTKKYEISTIRGFSIVDVFIDIYIDIDYLWIREYREVNYSVLGMRILTLADLLGFTEEEVEQAYMKKHKENYRRQEEGY